VLSIGFEQFPLAITNQLFIAMAFEGHQPQPRFEYCQHLPDPFTIIMCPYPTFFITSAIFLHAKSISFRVMISGGANRMTFSCVSLQRSPFFASASQ